MKVTVVERSKLTGGVISTPKIIIGDNCPVCGDARGKPFGHNFYEDGTSYWCQCWKNGCGHIDIYPNVIKEAKELAVPK